MTRKFPKYIEKQTDQGKIRKAYKFKLKTDKELEGHLFQMAGCCRLVWNKMLAMNLFRLENNADTVGAMNIKAAEHAVLACGESALADSVKQEPKVA